MTSKTTSILWWILAIIFTLSLAVYQRLTGPTYPVKGNLVINNTQIDYKLLRTADSDGPAELRINSQDIELTGVVNYKKFKVDENWSSIQMIKENNDLIGLLPPEPPAGKLEYLIVLNEGGKTYKVNIEPTVIRFKGPVPSFVLLPHILFMFLAMLFSTRTGIEALIKGSYTYQYAGFTFIFLLLGGMILGPIVQKFAFGAYWTGWPFGQDLTDNKTLVAFVAWLIAVVKLRKNSAHKTWAVIAALVLLAVYLIPHSMFGSELDYTSGEVTTGE